jgi:DNA-binding HxlR family transcriptional regulator
MDPYDKEILNALKDEKPRNFYQILDTATFSHKTLRLHFNSLVNKGLIVR